jgi:hypothetical protein
MARSRMSLVRLALALVPLLNIVIVDGRRWIGG